VVEFGERLCEEVLKRAPHRQWVFSIPKRLRIYFMNNIFFFYADQIGTEAHGKGFHPRFYGIHMDLSLNLSWFANTVVTGRDERAVSCIAVFMSFNTKLNCSLAASAAGEKLSAPIFLLYGDSFGLETR